MENGIIFHQSSIDVRNKKGSYINIRHDDILYIVYERSYSVIYYTGGKPIMRPESLSYIEKRLLPKDFFRSDQSVIINFKHYKECSLQNGKIEMDDGRILKLSRRNKKGFKKRLQAP